MRPKLSGKILFVFSDPGGAKPCLSFIEENNLINAIAISDRQYAFYKDFKTPVKILKQGVEQLIDTLKPDLIFTGTSYKSDIEQQFIKIGSKKSITCFSFVDHWTSISKRFEDSAGKRTLPNQVWVIDERAQQIAIQEGIDKTKIIISGNPYHDWLRNWKPKMSKENFIKSIDLQHQNKKILVYAPDPLSNINGTDTYGFDELSVGFLLVKFFEKYKDELKDWIVLVKAHPNQNRAKLEEVISDSCYFKFLPSDIDTNTTIYYADAVLGFFSSILIEASIMKKKILRLHLYYVEKDPLFNLNIGVVVDLKGLHYELSKFK